MFNKIVLIGPPGAGKSSIGKALAKELSLPFIDSDGEIEKSVGKKNCSLISLFLKI
jgi:shikimate kinase